MKGFDCSRKCLFVAAARWVVGSAVVSNGERAIVRTGGPHSPRTASLLSFSEGDDLIHAAAAEAAEIEGDVLVAEGAQLRVERGSD